ncbi:MAG: BON domain-containing protein [Dehalococcoidia bacterium]
MNQHRTPLVERLEEQLRQAGLAVTVEQDDASLVMTGIVGTEEERAAALDIAAEILQEQAAPALHLDEAITVSGAMPEGTPAGDLSTSEVGGFRGATPDLTDDEAIEAGDYTEQDTLDAPGDAQPASRSGDGRPLSDQIAPDAEDGEAYVPPTDPVGTDTEVIGGYARSSMDSVEVERSSDGRIGDGALRDAVIRELREDAATTGLTLDIEVIRGVVYLRGTVADILDVENAEEVAARLEGVESVVEALDVAGMERDRG